MLFQNSCWKQEHKKQLKLMPSQHKTSWRPAALIVGSILDPDHFYHPEAAVVVIKRQGGWLTCGVALNDWQVIHLQSGITPTPRKLHYMVLPIIYKLCRLLNINVISSHIKHNSNVSFVLRRQKHRRKTSVMLKIRLTWSIFFVCIFLFLHFLKLKKKT